MNNVAVLSWRAVLAAACTALIILALAVPSGAAPKRQTVKGSVAFAIQNPAFNFETCWYHMHRRLSFFSAGNVQGIIGYDFDIDKTTWDKPFVLKVTGGQNEPDLDVGLYMTYGSAENQIDPTFAPPGQVFETRKPGGEKGIVPNGATKALVCMYEGRDASFIYTAGNPVRSS